jgi:hypothetical protein
VPVIVLTSAAAAITIELFGEIALSALLEYAAHKALTQLGAYVMKEAKQEVKPAKSAARPGSPPHSHTGEFKRNIRFSYDNGTKSVVVGPTRLPSKSGDAPRALEKGGRSRIRSRGKDKVIKINPHPVMQPALTAVSPKLPALWANSLKE